MDPKEVYDYVLEQGYEYFTGVPDSLLKEFQNSISKSKHKNVVATHESQAVAMAFGAELAGKKACVYMQNSGLGNAINPLTSLCIPCGIEPLLVIGHRHTLHQHEIMGRIDEKLLKLIGYKNYIIVNGDNNVK